MSVNKVQLANGETIIDISDSTVTPETLAEGVTAHDASGTQITGTMKSGGGGGSVQSDWNQNDSSAADFIKNKPFGYVYGDTLTIETIDPDNFDFSTLVGEVFLKVCDTPVIMNDLANGYSVRFGSDTIEIPPEAVGETAMQIADGIFIFCEAFISIEEQGVGVDVDGMVFPESGLYAMVELLVAVGASLTIPGFGKFVGIQKLDEKYIPVGYKNIQADWNQTDETAADFIKNKPNNVYHINYSWIAGNNFYLLSESGENMTLDELTAIIDIYGASSLRLGSSTNKFDQLFVLDVNVSGYAYGIAAFQRINTINSEFTLQTCFAYTAEYTG